MVLLPFIVMMSGLVVPLASPLQPRKSQPCAGLALSRLERQAGQLEQALTLIAIHKYRQWRKWLCKLRIFQTPKRACPSSLNKF